MDQPGSFLVANPLQLGVLRRIQRNSFSLPAMPDFVKPPERVFAKFDHILRRKHFFVFSPACDDPVGVPLQAGCLAINVEHLGFEIRRNE